MDRSTDVLLVFFLSFFLCLACLAVANVQAFFVQFSSLHLHDFFSAMFPTLSILLQFQSIYSYLSFALSSLNPKTHHSSSFFFVATNYDFSSIAFPLLFSYSRSFFFLPSFSNFVVQFLFIRRASSPIYNDIFHLVISMYNMQQQLQDRKMESFFFLLSTMKRYFFFVVTSHLFNHQFFILYWIFRECFCLI